MPARLLIVPLFSALLAAAPVVAQGQDQNRRSTGDEPILVQPDGPPPERNAPEFPDSRADQRQPDRAETPERAGEPAPGERRAPRRAEPIAEPASGAERVEPRRERRRRIEPDQPPAEDGYWSPYLSLEAKVGDDRNIGTVDLLAPISQGAGWMLFADLRARFDDEDRQQGNFGLGFRRIMGGDRGGDGWVLGLNGFGDVVSSGESNVYYQFSLGAEALFEDWRVRANGYLPVNDEEELGGGSSARAALVGNSIRIQTTRVFEQPLPGFDAEVGYRLPIEDQQLWVYGGYFHFSDSGYEDISGPRVRGEWITHVGDVDFLPSGSQAVIGAEYQHDDVRDSRVFGTFALRVPFGEANRSIDSGDYSENWRTWAMLARVQRETGPVIATREETVDQPAVDPLTGQPMNLFFVDGDGSNASTGTRGAPLTLQQAQAAAGPSDILFLLGGDGSIDAANAPGGSLTLRRRQQVRGVGDAATTVIGLPSQPVDGDFALRIGSPAGRPVLTNANPANNVVNLANGATVQGVAITGGATGISGDGIAGADPINLRQLAVRNTGGDAIDLRNVGERTVVLSGIDIDDTGQVGGTRGGGIRLRGNPEATFLTAGLDVATENGPGLVAVNSGTINNLGAGPTINATGGAAVNIENTRGQINGRPGFLFESLASTDSPAQGVRLVDVAESVLVRGDATVTNAAAQGVLAQNFDGNVRFTRINVNGAATGIRLTGTAASTGGFTVGPLPPMNPQAPFNAVAGDGGIIQNIRGDAVSIANAPAASLNFLSIDASGGDDGIEATTTGSTAPTLVLRGNEVRAANQGVQLAANGIADLTVSVLGNTVNSGGSAIMASDDGSGGTLRLAVRNNTLTSRNQRAINIAGSAPGGVAITRFDNNTINPSGDGVRIRNALFDADPAAGGIQAVPGGSTNIARATFRTPGAGLELRNVAGELSFDELNVFNDGGTGLFVRPTAGGFALGVGDGRIDTTNGPAIDVAGANLNVQLDRAGSTNSAGAGVALDSVTGRLRIDDADITGAGGDGVRVADSNADVRIESAQITGVGGSAVAINDSGGTYRVNDAVINNTGQDAITATATGPDVLTLRISGAEISGAGGDGIALLNQAGAAGGFNATVAGNSVAANGTAFNAASAGNGGTFNLNLRANDANNLYRLSNSGDSFRFAGEIGRGMTFSGSLNGNVADNNNTSSGGPPNVNATGDFMIVAPDTVPTP